MRDISQASHHAKGGFFQGTIATVDQNLAYLREEGLFFINNDLEISKIADNLNDDVSKLETHDDFVLVLDGKSNSVTTYARNG